MKPQTFSHIPVFLKQNQNYKDLLTVIFEMLLNNVMFGSCTCILLFLGRHIRVHNASMLIFFSFLSHLIYLQFIICYILLFCAIYLRKVTGIGEEDLQVIVI